MGYSVVIPSAIVNAAAFEVYASANCFAAVWSRN